MSESPRKSSRLRQAAIAMLVVAGLSLMTAGVQRWLDSRAARNVVHTFFDALRDGDRQTAMTLLHPARAAAIESEPDGSDQSSWLPEAGLDYEIHQVDVTGARAAVRVRIKKDGFALAPVVHLLRSPTSMWKIDRIEQLAVDPRWEDLLDARAEAQRQAGEQLAEELRSTLEGRPGVDVERVPLDNLTE